MTHNLSSQLLSNHYEKDNYSTKHLCNFDYQYKVKFIYSLKILFLRIILTEQVNIHLQFQNRGNIKELIQQKYILYAINVSE